MKKWMGRKFLATVVAAATVVAVNLGVPEEVAARISETLLWILGIYVGAEGAADVVSRWKNPTSDRL